VAFYYRSSDFSYSSNAVFRTSMNLDRPLLMVESTNARDAATRLRRPEYSLPPQNHINTQTTTCRSAGSRSYFTGNDGKGHNQPCPDSSICSQRAV